MKDFDRMQREYERLQEKNRGGPGYDDEYDELTAEELEDIADRRLELAIEKQERRRLW